MLACKHLLFFTQNESAPRCFSQTELSTDRLVDERFALACQLDSIPLLQFLSDLLLGQRR